ncbi:MAG TPA: phytanoyl-CoA dioxygenase family protein [Nitriliruptorales bacterium]
MNIDQLETGSGHAAAYRTLRDLGLASHVAEIDAFGFTVIPPELAAPDGLADRLLERLLEISAQRNGGIVPDVETGSTHGELLNAGGQHMFFLLQEGRVFEEALMNPVALAFSDYLVGQDAIFSSMTSMVKGPGKLPLRMHSDQPIHPIDRALVCNASYLLTDYSRENGALCFVPGSHRAQRQPIAAENWLVDGGPVIDAVEKVKRGEDVAITVPPNVVPVEAPAGSMVVWHGNTWHGAFNRTTPGLRVNLIMYFSSPALLPQEPYRERLPQEVLDRNDETFARLMGRDVWYGFTDEGPQYEPGVAFELHRKRARAGFVDPAVPS